MQIKSMFPPQQQFSFKKQPVSIKCAQKNPAFMICGSSMCNKSGLCCLNQNCKCNIQHSNCVLLKLKNFVDRIKARSTNSAPLLNHVNQIFDNIIDQISLIRQQAETLIKKSGLNGVESQFLKNIQQSNFSKISGKLVSSMNNQDLKQKNVLNEQIIKRITNIIQANQSDILDPFYSIVKALQILNKQNNLANQDRSGRRKFAKQESNIRVVNIYQNYRKSQINSPITDILTTPIKAAQNAKLEYPKVTITTDRLGIPQNFETNKKQQNPNLNIRREYLHEDRRGNERRYDGRHDDERRHERGRDRRDQERRQDRRQKPQTQVKVDGFKIAHITPDSEDISFHAKVLFTELIKGGRPMLRCILGDQTGIVNGFIPANRKIAIGNTIHFELCYVNLFNGHIQIQMRSRSSYSLSQKIINSINKDNKISSKKFASENQN